MAHTARKGDEKREYFDPPEVLKGKIDTLVQWIRDSKHMIAFTGAGISTGAGIPDFRSGMDTAVQTGPGVWELRAKKKDRDQKHEVTSTLKAIPTPTHMMLVKLYQEGILKCCVSQNTDGLHRRSGLPKSGLCELHGNSNLERCKKCGKEYLRDMKVRTGRGKSHLTGRKCDDPKCMGPLKDTIINFGQDLPEDELTKATEEGEKADLCLAMGSSLTVTPAADIPERVAERNEKLVIVNLQKTPLDSMASLVIHAKCEDVSRLVMSCLGLEMSEFKLRRRLLIGSKSEKNGDVIFFVQGRDMDGLPFTFFKEVLITVNSDRHTLLPPFNKKLGWKEGTKELKVKITVTFNGNYGEPPLTREVTIKKGKDLEEALLIMYSPGAPQWEVVTAEEEIARAMATASITS